MSDISEIKMTYKNNKGIVKIFWEKFVENNQNCKMIIDKKEYLIAASHNFTNYNNENIIIELIGNKNITNMSYMFYNCSSLLAVNITKLDTEKIKDMSHMFEGCLLLKSLSDISYWNTNNITDMSYMFKECLSSLLIFQIGLLIISLI